MAEDPKVADTPTTFVSIYETTWHHITEHHNGVFTVHTNTLKGLNCLQFSKNHSPHGSTSQNCTVIPFQYGALHSHIPVQ
jgi:hypothetical protein